MIKHSIFSIIATAILSLSITSCNDEMLIDESITADVPGVEVIIPFKTKLINEKEATRSDNGTRAVPDNLQDGTEEGYKVHDIWLLQFDPDGKRIGSPLYYEIEGVENPSVKVVKSSADYKIKYVVIANTYDESFDMLKSVSTVDELRNVYYKISKEEDLFVKGSPDSDKYELLMNGDGEIKTDSNGNEYLAGTLYRNVAKVEVTVKSGADSGMKILNYTIHDVTPRVLYADHQFDNDPITDIPEYDPMIDYEQVSFADGIAPGQQASFTVFLPRNKKGVANSSASLKEWDKNNFAPENATYLDIVAQNESNQEMYMYRFYLGANLKDNFNIEPNNIYKYTINIVEPGSEMYDSRVYEFTPIEFPTSNCYIVNPAHLPRKYSFPIDRINEFWSDPNYVTDNNIRVGHTILPNTEWEAEVIWQDIDARAISFINAPDGSGTASADGTKFNGKGLGKVYFTTYEQNYNKKGNVLIGVKLKEKKDEYLWSWHLWLTDYDPDDYKGLWEDGRYTYTSARMNGNIHRYNTNSLWNWTTNNPLYRDRFIMDRALGADSYERNGLRNGMFYYYGRKDPIALGPIYDINGKQLEKNFDGTDPGSGDLQYFVNSGDQVSIYKGVEKPTYIYGNGQYGYNSQVRSNTNYIWDDYKCDPNGKSIFDPCPPGWMIPKVGTFDGFVNPTSNNYNSSFKFGGNNSDIAVFPIVCSITNGKIDYKNTWSGYWYNSASSANNAYMIWISGSQLQPRPTASKSCGFYIRPVREMKN